MIRLAILLTASAALPLARASAQVPDSSVTWVQGGPFRLKAAVYRHSNITAAPTLVIVLHGDAPFNKPDYQDRFATAVATTYPNTVAAAILRPGYTDPAGHTSEGVRGETTGDNYTAGNADALAAAIVTLRDRFHSPTVVLVGHSGGAALVASILGRHPTLATAALLVSCPCDVVQWRAHMFRKTQFAGFDGPIVALSPVDLVDSLSPMVRVHMLVGERDDVTPPELTRIYAARATARGVSIAMTTLAGEGHEILLKAEVLHALRPLLP